MAEESDQTTEAEKSKGQAPYEKGLLTVIEKVNDQTFLLVIAVGILLIGATVLGIPDSRFVTVTLALLCLVVIGGYYFVRYKPPKVAEGEQQTSKQKHAQILRSKTAIRFWRPFIAGGLRVVVGRFLEFAPFEQTGLMGVGDAVGLTELRTFFGVAEYPDFSILYSDQIRGDELKANLIVIGGPDNNSVTQDIVSKLKTTLKFGDPSRYEIVLFDSKENRSYAPKAGSRSTDIELDYGLIIRARNPYYPSTSVIIIAGSFGYGTWAGIRMLTNEDLLKNNLVLSGKSFECLFETSVFRGTPQTTKLISVRSLNDAI